MNRNRFDLEVAFAICGLVRHGKTVMLNFAFTEHDIEFGSNQVLKHRTNIVSEAP